MQTVADLNKLGYECPEGTVTTGIYFARAGCNSESFSLRDKHGMNFLLP